MSAVHATGVTIDTPFDAQRPVRAIACDENGNITDVLAITSHQAGLEALARLFPQRQLDEAEAANRQRR